MWSCVYSTVEYWQWMCLSIENPPVQRQYIVGREQQIKVLECFSEKEALLYVVMRWRHSIDIFDTGVAIVGTTPLLNCLNKANIN